MTLNFRKMNGAGNDFVMLDNRDLSISLTRGQIERLCDRHRGIGADGVLAVEPAGGAGDFKMRYYNADGGEAEMCGNGARCFARFVNRLVGDKLKTVSFETQAGLISAEFVGDEVRINMSTPHSYRPGLAIAGTQFTVHSINTGVPHAVVIVDDLESVPVREWGSHLRYHEEFEPKGTNVNFARIIAPGSIAIRTYERGVEDETLACGTGVVACALIHHELTGAPSPISVQVKGGETLSVGFDQSVAHEFTSVTLFGPADFVFEGTVELA